MTEANVVYATVDKSRNVQIKLETPQASGNRGVDADYDDIEVEPQAELATISLPANQNRSIRKRNRTVFMMTIMNTMVIVFFIGLFIVLFTIVLFMKEPTKTEPVEGPPIETVTTPPEQLPTTEADKSPDRNKYPYPYNGYTYKRTRLARTWSESRSYCQQIGGDLASVGMKNYTLRRMITSYLELGDVEWVWVGAYDFHSEGEWVWVDGSPVDNATAEWRPNEPNNNGDEDCADIFTKSYDRLNDASCDNRFVAICETKFT